MADPNDERRDSPRVPMTFLVRDITENGEWLERSGDLSIGGIYFEGKLPPHGSNVDVRFRLTGVPSELRARGEILRVKDKGEERIDFHVRFTELDVQTELSIARFIDTALA